VIDAERRARMTAAEDAISLVLAMDIDVLGLTDVLVLEDARDRLLTRRLTDDPGQLTL
jgi:hypothetical protein